MCLPREFRKSRLLMMVLVFIAFALRIDRLDFQSLWRDEVDAIYFAVQPLASLFGMFTEGGHNGPLYFLLLRPWFWLVGANEFTLRYLSVWAGTLSVVLIWQVARRLLVSSEKGILDHGPLLAAIFLALNPYQLWYSQEGKMYALIVCLTLLSSCFWLLGIQRGGWWRWLLYFIFTSLCFYFHVLAALIIPLHFVWFCISWPSSRRYGYGYAISLAGLTLPYLPMVWWQWAILTDPNYSAGYPFVSLPNAMQLLLVSHSRGIMHFGSPLWLFPVYFLVIVGLFMGVSVMGQSDRQPLAISPRRRLALIASWFFIPILLLHTISLVVPLFVDRYLIWIAPAFAICLALGIQVVRQHAGQVGWSLSLALLLSILLFWLTLGEQQKTQPIKADLRGAVAYLEQYRSPNELLILQIPHMQYSYRYYTSNFNFYPFTNSAIRLAPWARGMHTNKGLSDSELRAQVRQKMNALTIGHTDVWVLLSEAEMWDSRRLMDEWLAQNGQLVEEVTYQLVQVRHYKIKTSN